MKQESSCKSKFLRWQCESMLTLIVLDSLEPTHPSSCAAALAQTRTLLRPRRFIPNDHTQPCLPKCSAPSLSSSLAPSLTCLLFPPPLRALSLSKPQPFLFSFPLPSLAEPPSA